MSERTSRVVVRPRKGGGFVATLHAEGKRRTVAVGINRQAVSAQAGKAAAIYARGKSLDYVSIAAVHARRKAKLQRTSPTPSHTQHWPERIDRCIPVADSLVKRHGLDDGRLASVPPGGWSSSSVPARWPRRSTRPWTDRIAIAIDSLAVGWSFWIPGVPGDPIRARLSASVSALSRKRGRTFGTAAEINDAGMVGVRLWRIK